MNRAAHPNLLLVCSAGGHVLQLFRLHQALLKDYPHQWVALKEADTSSLLADQQVHWAFGPTNRNIPNLIRNCGLAWRLLRRIQPTHIISTGAAVAVPFMLLGRLLGAKTIYIESFARQHQASLTGHMMYPFVHTFVVQNANLLKRFPRAVYRGSVYPAPTQEPSA